MKRPLPPKIAKILVRLSNGEILPASSAKHPFVTCLIEEGIIISKGKHRKTLQVYNKYELTDFIENQLQISDLENYVSILEQEEVNRFDLIKTTKDSKTKKVRTLKAFLINSYTSISATLNGKRININPAKGSFIFISDFESFIPSPEVTIVGVENAENFNLIEKQKYLFDNITSLFISRYPQSQNKDVIQWLKSLKNSYLHFGDFDISGIGIYLNEYKKHLGERAKFFVPNNIAESLKESGNRERYDVQSVNFKPELIEEKELIKIYELIQEEKKGLDQEYYIDENANA
jgi:hypothetical protein